MNQIIVAVDEHEHAEKVVDYAIGLAKTSGAKIILANAVAKKSIPRGLGDEYRDEDGKIQADQYYHDIFDKTVAALEKRLEKAKVEYEGVYGVGDPSKFILKLADDKEADMVVVGIHGRRRLGRLLTLTEVARNIIEASTIPVVAVP